MSMTSRMGSCWSRDEQKVTVPMEYTPLQTSLRKISEATNETEDEGLKEIEPLSI
jgi:hypothetical protein